MNMSYSEWADRLASGEVINGLHECGEYSGAHRADHSTDTPVTDRLYGQEG